MSLNLLEQIKIAYKSLRVFIGTTGVVILSTMIGLREQTLAILGMFVEPELASNIMMVLGYIVAIGTTSGLIHGATRSKSKIPLEDR